MEYNSNSKVPSIGPLYKELTEQLDPDDYATVRASSSVWTLQQTLNLSIEATQAMWNSMVLDSPVEEQNFQELLIAQSIVKGVIDEQRKRWGDLLPIEPVEESILRLRFGIYDDRPPLTFAQIDSKREELLIGDWRPGTAHQIGAETLGVIADEIYRESFWGAEYSMLVDVPNKDMVVRKAAQLIINSERHKQGITTIAQWLRENTHLNIDEEELAEIYDKFRSEYIFTAKPHLRSIRLKAIAVFDAVVGYANGVHAKQPEVKQQLGLEAKTNVGSIKGSVARALAKYIEKNRH